MKKVEFYFDLGSPYSYIGFYRMLQIAEQNQIDIEWKPMLLGGIFKATGNSSPMMVPAKARYSMMDLKRWAKYWNIPVKMNPFFPINTLNIMRIVTAVQLYQPENFLKILSGLFEAMFKNPKNLNDHNEFIQVLNELGIDAAQGQAWLTDENVKTQLKNVTEQAIEKGVFGAPTWFVEDEMFWGVDHLFFVENKIKE